MSKSLRTKAKGLGIKVTKKVTSKKGRKPYYKYKTDSEIRNLINQKKKRIKNRKRKHPKRLPKNFTKSQLQNASTTEKLKVLKSLGASDRDITHSSKKTVRTKKQYRKWLMSTSKYDLPKVDDGTINKKKLQNVARYWNIPYTKANSYNAMKVKASII